MYESVRPWLASASATFIIATSLAPKHPHSLLLPSPSLPPEDHRLQMDKGTWKNRLTAMPPWTCPSETIMSEAPLFEPPYLHDTQWHNQTLHHQHGAGHAPIQLSPSPSAPSPLQQVGTKQSCPTLVSDTPNNVYTCNAGPSDKNNMK